MKADKRLHIVSFNVPYPADYGGVIDVFYRIKALYKLGVDVHLHAFTYGRSPSEELNRYCSEVSYYPRRAGIASALTSKPYIVESRVNSQLIANLGRDDAPILLEGLHCCSVLEALGGDRIFVRAHNVEHDYYTSLAGVERNPLRRIYLKTDARRLRRYEPVLLKAAAVLAVTEADMNHFRAIGCPNVLLMPSSHPDEEVVSSTGMGDYAFYHADLSVGENIDAALYLIDQVFSQSGHRLIVAGRNPSGQIYRAADRLGNITVVANPSDGDMRRMMADAQVQILVTKLSTGLKLKLLNSLYGGRHCLVNSKMVAGTRLGELCTVADSAEQLRDSLNRLMQTPFTDADINHRRQLLGDLYSNEANAKKLLSLL